MSKWATTGNQRSYRLTRLGAGTIKFDISSTGAAITSQVTSTTTVSTDWTFVWAKFDPSANIYVGVNYDVFSAVSADAAIFNSTAQFTLGSVSTGTLMTGSQSYSALYCMYHTHTVSRNIYQQTRALFGV